MKKILDIDIDVWCIPLSFLFGVIVGVSVPGNSDLSPGYRRASSVIGWIYFFAWTLSFYPQVFLNAARKNTVGMVSDKLVYDFIGFSCLSVYCIAMYYVDSVRNEYRDHYNGNDPKVTLNDVCFAVHALLFTFVQIGQMAYYNGLTQLPSKLCLIGASITIVVIIIYLIICLKVDSNVFIMLYWLNFISYVKIAITMIKYIPQVLLNYQRKSTTGWSITACSLDLIGSIMSMLQLFLDCNDTNDWSGLVGDIVKFLLGLLSLGFDIIFIVQHYILYGDNGHYDTIDEQKRLLEEGNINDDDNDNNNNNNNNNNYHNNNESTNRDDINNQSSYSPPSTSPTATTTSTTSSKNTIYKVNQKIRYTAPSGLEEFIGEVIAVHLDAPDGIPYYTIRYNSPDSSQLREKQTDGNRIKPYQSSLSSSSSSLLSGVNGQKVEKGLNEKTLETESIEEGKISVNSTGNPIYYTSESIWE